MKPLAKGATGPRHVGEAELGREHDPLDPGDREVHAAEREQVARTEVRGNVGLLGGECRRVEQQRERIDAGAAVEMVRVGAASAEQLRLGGEEQVAAGAAEQRIAAEPIDQSVSAAPGLCRAP